MAAASWACSMYKERERQHNKTSHETKTGRGTEGSLNVSAITLLSASHGWMQPKISTRNTLKVCPYLKNGTHHSLVYLACCLKCTKSWDLCTVHTCILPLHALKAAYKTDLIQFKHNNYESSLKPSTASQFSVQVSTWVQLPQHRLIGDRPCKDRYALTFSLSARQEVQMHIPWEIVP